MGIVSYGGVEGGCSTDDPAIPPVGLVFTDVTDLSIGKFIKQSMGL